MVKSEHSKWILPRSRSYVILSDKIVQRLNTKVPHHTDVALTEVLLIHSFINLQQTMLRQAQMHIYNIQVRIMQITVTRTVLLLLTIIATALIIYAIIALLITWTFILARKVAMQNSLTYFIITIRALSLARMPNIKWTAKQVMPSGLCRCNLRIHLPAQQKNTHRLHEINIKTTAHHIFIQRLVLSKITT